MKLGYVIKRMLRMDFGRVGSDIARVSQKSGKSKLHIFFDMAVCGVKYGAGPLDYELFEFYTKSGKQRKTYVTRGVNNSLVKKYNSPEYKHIFDNKSEFNKTFTEYVHRDWLLNTEMTAEQYDSFVSDKEEFIYKPIEGTCGRGIEKLRVSDMSFDIVKAMPAGIIEEIIIQHSEISRVYPLAINTIRMVTIFKDGKATPVFAFWRIGNNGRYVDNLNSGGMAAKLDITTGTVTLPAADKNGIAYTTHPYTNESIVGFVIPMWDKITETVCRAAENIPQVGYVGWDVAVSQNSVQIIEGNEFPGHDILQLPAYTPDGIGLKPNIEKYL